MRLLKAFLAAAGRWSGAWVPALVLSVFGIVYRDLLACRVTFVSDAVMWYGTFNYYIEQLGGGVFPYWDPYSLTGTPFYPNISGYGLLEPVVLILVVISKLFSVSPFTLFIYFRIWRILVFVGGAFLLFRYSSRNSALSALSAGILLFAVMPQNIAMPMMDYCFTVPLALYLILLFLDNIDFPKRYILLLSLTLLTGVTMNVFIPAFYLFNVFFFVLILFLTKRYSILRVLRAFADRKLLLTALACLLLLIMMSAPPFAVYLFDVAGDGELFAVSKMVDATNGSLKEVMASDLGGDAFFDKMREGRGVFISLGSLLDLISPDIAGLRQRNPADLSPEIPLYIGMTSMVLICAGLVFSRSCLFYSALAMAGLVMLAAFSFTGVHGNYNPVQHFLNAVFPPLRMTDMRINSSSLLLLYLCMSLCLAAASLSRNDGVRGPAPRLIPLAILVMSYLLIKAGIAFYMTGGFLLSVRDLLAAAVPLLLLGGASAARRWKITAGLLVYAFLTISLAEMVLAGTALENRMTHSSDLYDLLAKRERHINEAIAASGPTNNGFPQFRVPYVPYNMSPIPTFVEATVGIKGVMPANSLAAIFTTKRYYDLLSHVSPRAQMVVGGVAYPMIRFFPGDRAVVLPDDSSVLDALRNSDPAFLGHSVYLESAFHPRQPAAGGTSLNDVRDVPWYNGSIISEEYFSDLRPFLMTVWAKSGSPAAADSAAIVVAGFSVNELILSVENQSDGYLLFSDGWSRYWKAYDNGKQVPVLAANYNSKAVFLPKGDHAVRFVFDPVHYKTALALYYSALLICSGSMIFLWRKSRMAVQRPPADNA